MQLNTKLTVLSILTSFVLTFSFSALAAPLTSDVKLHSIDASPKNAGSITIEKDSLDKFPTYTIICKIDSDEKAHQAEDLFYLDPHLSFSVNGQIVNTERGIGSLPKNLISTLKIPGIKGSDIYIRTMTIYLHNLDDTDTIRIRNCVATVEK
jgi:hypothetical protein